MLPVPYSRTWSPETRRPNYLENQRQNYLENLENLNLYPALEKLTETSNPGRDETTGFGESDPYLPNVWFTENKRHGTPAGDKAHLTPTGDRVYKPSKLLNDQIPPSIHYNCTPTFPETISSHQSPITPSLFIFLLNSSFGPHI